MLIVHCLQNLPQLTPDIIRHGELNGVIRTYYTFYYGHLRTGQLGEEDLRRSVWEAIGLPENGFVLPANGAA